MSEEVEDSGAGPEGEQVDWKVRTAGRRQPAPASSRSSSVLPADWIALEPCQR
jgi:hypothetical protein